MKRFGVLMLAITFVFGASYVATEGVAAKVFVGGARPGVSGKLQGNNQVNQGDNQLGANHQKPPQQQIQLPQQQIQQPVGNVNQKPKNLGQKNIKPSPKIQPLGSYQNPIKISSSGKPGLQGDTLGNQGYKPGNQNNQSQGTVSGSSPLFTPPAPSGNDQKKAVQGLSNLFPTNQGNIGKNIKSPGGINQGQNGQIGGGEKNHLNQHQVAHTNVKGDKYNIHNKYGDGKKDGGQDCDGGDKGGKEGKNDHKGGKDGKSTDVDVNNTNTNTNTNTNKNTLTAKTGDQSQYLCFSPTLNNQSKSISSATGIGYGGEATAINGGNTMNLTLAIDSSSRSRGGRDGSKSAEPSGPSVLGGALSSGFPTIPIGGYDSGYSSIQPTCVPQQTTCDYPYPAAMVYASYPVDQQPVYPDRIITDTRWAKAEKETPLPVVEECSKRTACEWLEYYFPKPAVLIRIFNQYVRKTIYHCGGLLHKLSDSERKRIKDHIALHPEQWLEIKVTFVEAENAFCDGEILRCTENFYRALLWTEAKKKEDVRIYIEECDLLVTKLNVDILKKIKKELKKELPEPTALEIMAEPSRKK